MTTSTTPSPPLTILSPRLLIRVATLSDVPSALRIGADLRNTLHQPHMNMEPHTVERTTKWITSNLERYINADPKDGAYLAIEERSTGEFIGDTGQGWGSSRTGWTGVMLDYEKRGHGYAVEALWSIFNWSFAKPPNGQPIGLSEGCDLDDVMLGTSSENTPMRGVLEKVFDCVGEEKEVKNAEKRGLKVGAIEVIYRITKADWEGGMEARVRTWLEGRWNREGVKY